MGLSPAQVVALLPEPGNATLTRLTEPLWWVTKDGDRTCLALYCRHYSSRKRKKRTIAQFVGPGACIVLRTADGDAVFVWRDYINDIQPKQEGIECALFRNESPHLSSELIRQADAIADFCWPSQRHYTQVDPAYVGGNPPGSCFLHAGWKRWGETKTGKLILERL